MREYQNTKIFLLNSPNWSEEVFFVKKIEIQFHGRILLMILMVKKLLKDFMKKNCKR